MKLPLQKLEQLSRDRSAFDQVEEQQIEARLLRGDVLTAVCRFILERGAQHPWLSRYYWILTLPRFLNIAFTSGACNSACRMCVGRRDGRDLRFVSLAQMRSMLDQAFTAAEVTLSASDSDPLLNPAFIPILSLFRERGIACDFYTNGLALTPDMSRAIVDSGAVNMINFSLDAATAATYRAVRGRSLEKVQAHIRYLVEEKARQRKQRPWLSVSMVGMADNIGELPALVEYARSIGAFRVIVQPLIECGDDAVNQSCEADPAWTDRVAEAVEVSVGAQMNLELPGKLLHLLHDATAAVSADGLQEHRPDEAREAAAKMPGTGDVSSEPTLPCCRWIRGIWIDIDGHIRPCCLNSSVDLGSIYSDGIRNNTRFLLYKMKLLTGTVFGSCLRYVDQCSYLAEQRAAGRNFSAMVMPQSPE
jgi:MoaA/NifB/PqqE/SkfB family radical SAM enzyme